MAQTMYTGRLVARRTPDLYGRYGWAAYQTQKRTESSQQDGVQAIQDEQPTPRKRRRRKTDPWTPRRKRTVSKMKQEEPVSVYKALSDEEKQSIRSFNMLGLPTELRYMIVDYLLPHDIQDHTLNFENGFSDGSFELPHWQVNFLPRRPIHPIALMRSCTQLREDVIVQFLSCAHIRLIMHNLRQSPITAFKNTSCQNPHYADSPIRSISMPQPWLLYMRTLTVWTILPCVSATISATTDWSFLAKMPALQRLEVVFKANHTSPSVFVDVARARQDVETINQYGGSDYLLGTFISLLSNLPEHVGLFFTDFAAELRMPRSQHIRDRSVTRARRIPLIWSPQLGSFAIDPEHHEWKERPVESHQVLKEDDAWYERHYGPACAVRSDVMQRLYDRFKSLQGTKTAVAF